MKRIFSLVMVSVLVFLTGCGGVKKNSVHSLDDLKGKTIGVQLKTTGDAYASDIEGATVTRFNEGRDAVRALSDGKIDAVMLDDAPANVFVEEFGDVCLLDEAYADEEYGIAVKKGNKELLKKINEALATLKGDGTIDKIMDQWLNGDVETTAHEGQEKETYKNGVLAMATNAEFPPYESKTEDGEIIGIDVDIMKAVCDQLDMKLQVNHTAFDSIIASVERGMADVGVAAMTISEDRLKQVDFSDTYVAAKQVIIVRKD